jgi:hypothetical protein
MGALAKFIEYAQDFETTYDDDDWSRLERYFAPDAVYEVRNTSFACRLEGPKAILRGLKKSLDGFDRRMPKRVVAPTDDMREEPDCLVVGWTATYSPPGAPVFVLRGRSTARYRDGVLFELIDEYPDGMDEEAAAWVRQHAPGLDASYA